MTETEKMESQENKNVEVVTSFNNVPYFVIDEDLSNSTKNEYYAEVNEINQLYVDYKKGIKFISEGSNGDYVPSDVRFKKAASIVNKEARFLFANPPTFKIAVDGDDEEKFAAESSILHKFVSKVLRKNNFNGKLLKAAKDCFIGKRIAIALNFNDDTGISITFLNSLEFVYELSDRGDDELQKIVMFYNQNDVPNKREQRWFKKVYELENGIVYVQEALYDGLGTMIEDITPRRKTKFTYIPAVVILNDGLTGDVRGESELGYLLGYEGTYSKLANADVDAERKSMNPIRYAIDASQESTANLSIAPGAFWDIQSDEEKSSESVKATVGQMESNMSYSNALKTTLDRIENAMYAEVDVPNITGEKLQGIITSGKTISALYWGLTVRCDEKMILSWLYGLEFIATAIIEGGKLYPKSITRYTSESSLPDIEVEVTVENNYPLPEDINEEKNMDLAEVHAQVMSKKSYLKKWRNLTDKQAEDEIQQIKAEMDLFEGGAMMPETDMSDLEGGEEDEMDLESGEFALDDDDDSEIDAMFDSFLSELEADDEDDDDVDDEGGEE